MLHLGAPPCTSPSVVNLNVTWSSRDFFGASLLYTPPYSPGPVLIVALPPLIVTSPVPNVCSRLPLPANAAAGRTRAETASAVKIHFFMLSFRSRRCGIAIAQARRTARNFFFSRAINRDRLTHSVWPSLTSPAGPNWVHRRSVG